MDGLAEALNRGPDGIPLHILVRRVLSRNYETLVDLQAQLRDPKCDDAERKQVIMVHLKQCKDQLQRLVQITRWLNQDNGCSVVEQHHAVKRACMTQDAPLYDAANKLHEVWARMNDSTGDGSAAGAALQGQGAVEGAPAIAVCRAPRFDIATAVEVLTTGTYRRLPSLIEERCTELGHASMGGARGAAQAASDAAAAEASVPAAVASRRALVASRLEHRILLHLLDHRMPRTVSHSKLSGGVLTLTLEKGGFRYCLSVRPLSVRPLSVRSQLFALN